MFDMPKGHKTPKNKSNAEVDGGIGVDWGKTSRDYAEHRPGPPLSFYQKLAALEIGLPGQTVLDLGTGTGVIARQMARQGCKVWATDISDTQVKMAQTLATEENLDITFATASAETTKFADHRFDVITAHQCFLYFDLDKALPAILKMLKPNGVLVISHFSWLPLICDIAKASEELILRHNPKWQAHSYSGRTYPNYPGMHPQFHYSGYFYYDVETPFTRESWRGRIRASRGVGASMNAAEITAFDAAHAEMLETMTEGDFTVTHRIDAHIFSAGSVEN